MRTARPLVIAVLAIASAVALVLIPLCVSNYGLRLATTGLMYVAVASSWNIIGGFTGYPSFATAAFFGAGAYVAGVLQSHTDIPLPLAWIAGALASALFAVLIGIAILRLRGHYFAVASLVLAPVLREIVNGADFTGGGMGINLPGSTRFGVQATSQFYYVVMLGCALSTMVLAAVIVRTRLGWAMRCIQQNEEAALVIGIDTLMVKVAAFAASASTAGLVGAVYATWIGYIDPADVFDDALSVTPIVIVFLGGIGSISGPIVGAVAFLVLEEALWRNFLNFHAGFLGLVIVALLLFLPGGLMGLPVGRDVLVKIAPSRFGRRPAIAEAEPKL